MKKSRLLCLGLVPASFLLLSTTTFAANYKGEAMYKGEPAPAPCAQPLMLHDGFYVGAGVGYDSYRVRRNTNVTFNGLQITGNPAVNPTGFAGELLGGYGQTFQSMYYLGGEAFVSTSGASVSSARSNITTTSVYSTNFSVGTGYGLAILPGIKVNDSSLVYARLGYNWVRLTGKESFTVAGLNTSATKNNWSNGFNYGAGIETAVYQNFSVRGEYSHTNYSSFTSALGTNYSPSNNQFMFSVLYHFA